MNTFDVTLSVTYRVDADSDEDAINAAIFALESDIKSDTELEYFGDVKIATDN
jgi:hypothetical protein